MQLQTLIQQYLTEAKMMHLATVSNGKPWVCSVWFAADDDMNIYWFSSTTRRHSLEVKNDNHVAGSMCLPQTPEDTPRGLQLEGTAEMLTEEADIQKAKSLYECRIFPAETVEMFMKHPERPHMFYRIVPELFVLFDVANFPDNPRQEYRPEK